MATNDFGEYQDKMEAQFEGLKSFTMKTLGEIKCEVNAMGNRIAGLEELIAAVAAKKLPAICKSVVTLEQDLKELREKVTVDTQLSAKNPSIFAPTSRTRVEEPETVPVVLEDISSSELRQAVEPYYKADCIPGGGGGLTPVQLAYVHYFLKVLKAHSEVITELLQSGTKDKMWCNGFEPGGIKGQFAAYIKEKVRNLSKKRLSELAANEFAMAFAENI